MSLRAWRRRLVAMALPCMVTCGACGGDDAAGGDRPLEVDVCTAESDTFAFGEESVGVMALGSSGAIQARVIKASPPTPARYENDWTLEFMDANGDPLDDVEVTGTCVYMPVHPHKDPVRKVTSLSSASQVELTGVNLFQRGPWTVDIAVKSPSVGGQPTQVTGCDGGRSNALGTDMLTIHACIED